MVGSKLLGDLVNKFEFNKDAIQNFKNEAIWKSDYKGKDINDDEIIDAMIANPKLIERPIVINNDKAVIGRPAEAIQNIL